MTEQLTTHELAKGLKEIGFDWPTRRFYPLIGGDSIEGVSGDYNYLETVASAPTLSHAQQYLREVHKIEVQPQVSKEQDSFGYIWAVIDLKTLIVLDNYFEKNITNDRLSFDAVLSQGLKAAVKIIKERLTPPQPIGVKLKGNDNRKYTY